MPSNIVPLTRCGPRKNKENRWPGRSLPLLSSIKTMPTGTLSARVKSAVTVTILLLMIWLILIRLWIGWAARVVTYSSIRQISTPRGQSRPYHTIALAINDSLVLLYKLPAPLPDDLAAFVLAKP